MRIEKVILKYLLKDKEFGQRILPFLKSDYFSDNVDHRIFVATHDYIMKYNKPPSLESLIIFMDSTYNVPSVDKKEYQDVLSEIVKSDVEKDPDWLLDATEKFCQEKALYNAMVDSLSIMKGQDKKRDKGIIPQLLQDALSVSFNPSIGHEYFEDAAERYAAYHTHEAKIPCDIDILNTIMNGGVPDKTLNVIIGGVNVGKTLMLCHLAAAYVTLGHDVLYVTMEMSEEKIAERIDANLMNVSMQDLALLTEDLYMKKAAALKSKTQGRLFIHEFPTSVPNVFHFKALLNDLKLKKDFKPTILIVDYINICSSARLKLSSDTYGYIKAVAEELRGLAVEMGLRVWTATQLNRTGFASSDPDMTNVAESFGLPATADFMIVVISNDVLEKLGQYMLKQIKNRYGGKVNNKVSIVGVDYEKMRLYNISQASIPDSGDGSKEVQVVPASTKLNKSKFEGLKV